MRYVMAILVLLVSFGMSAAATSQDLSDLESNCERGLANLGLTFQDLRIRSDYATPDLFRLPIVDSLMADPGILPDCVNSLAYDIESESLTAEMVYLLLDFMSLQCGGQQASKRQNLKDIVGNFSHLPPDLREALSRYLGGMALVDSLSSHLFTDAGNAAFAIRNFPSLIESRGELEDIGPLELYELEKQDEAIADSILKICEKLNLTDIASMAYVATQMAEDLRVDVENLAGVDAVQARYAGGRVRFEDSVAIASGSLVYLGSSPLGPIAIGGAEANDYQGTFALIVDLGGNDTYCLSSPASVRTRTIIDLDGNDWYCSREPFGLAGGCFGTSIIMDCGGDDIYQGDIASLGSAFCGCGILYDRRGDDLYISREFSQGAALMGIGLLHDRGGNDCYSAGMQSQAFGYVMGAGLILDRAGNDVYYTRMSQTDILRYDDHYLTLSQGCGFGWRPDYSGGIGLLIDVQGNDLYSSDIFGQGVGYWFAIGALVDRGGHDRYVSYQYAQGSGVHLAFGILLDDKGNDVYQSKGVSQGCGHDLSLGILTDFSGNDTYAATDLSQGAGNANATGILYDAGGNDAYSTMTTRNVNGYGNYRREFGSIGLQVDMRGNDFYGPVGRNEAIWGSGKYGLGLDAPGKASKKLGDIVVHEYPFEERSFSTRELFILACRGEPRFRRWRTYAFDRLVEDSLATIAYLRGVLDTQDARERHTIKDIIRAIGESAVPMLVDAVRTGNHAAQAEAVWILGIIGSSRAFDALMDLSYSDSWRLRSGAMNALGKIKPLTDAQQQVLARRITEILRDSLEVFYVKKDAAFAAGNQQICECIESLVSTLNSDHYSARLAAAEAIDQLVTAGCREVGETLLKSLPDLSGTATAAALRASHSLDTDAKIEIAKRVIAAGLVDNPMVASNLASLAKSIVPETKSQASEVQKLKSILASSQWDANTILTEMRSVLTKPVR